MFRFSSRLAVAVTLATVAVSSLLAVPSGVLAGSLVPFRVTVAETFTAGPCGPSSRCISAVGEGQATDLGKVSESAAVVVDLNPADAQGGCAPETRMTTLTAANGDTVTMTGTGWSCPTGDAQDNYLITGGTGRFQGAGGAGSEENSHTFTGPGVGVASVTYNGSITSVGSLSR
jgi:hypothetical protein